MLLLHKRKVTARELAEYFEVSIRTVQRDMETLSRAGIPLYGDVGKQGGYQLTENYRMDRSFLTQQEMDTLVTMLNGFKDALFSDSIRTILEKMGGIGADPTVQGNLLIDMAPWGEDHDFRKTLNNINRYIENRRLISFEYYDLNNQRTIRQVEPYRIILKSNSWYLYGYCRLRNEYRLFKILRIFQMVEESERFNKRDDSGSHSRNANREVKRESTAMCLKFSPEVKGRIPDFFDVKKATEDDSGFITFNVSFPIDEWLVSIFLGFGDGLEVIEPESLRIEMTDRIKKMQVLYKL